MFTVNEEMWLTHPKIHVIRAHMKHPDKIQLIKGTRRYFPHTGHEGI